MLTFPAIDPVAFHIGPLPVRWYALAYIAGIVLGWLYAKHLAKLGGKEPTPAHFDDIASWIVVSIILGGRLGYVLFYNLPYFFQHPAEALMVWKGGMSFHGGLAGVLIALYLFARREKFPFFAISDIIACVVPIGLFFGRIANFINGELFGRMSHGPFAMVFPAGGPVPRHPSQLYEACLEGIALFTILAILFHIKPLRERTGFISGMFLVLYALARAIVEFFREPDAQIGLLFGGITMGQILCIPMLLFGIWIILYSFKKRA